MSFKIVSKYLTHDDNDAVKHTVVQIVEDYPDYVAIQQRLEGDHVNEDDGTLIEKVLDLFYKKQFKDKANQEMLKVMEQKIQEVDDKLIEMGLLNNAMQEGLLELLSMQGEE